MPTIEKREFLGLMTKLRAHYQNGISDEKLWMASVASYYEALSGEDPERIRRAFREAWRYHPSWMPSCGQMLELIEGHGGAHKAWPEVLALASRSSGEHSDPIAAEAIRRMGGVRALGSMDNDRLKVWAKREFIGLYEQVKREAAIGEGLPKLQAAPNEDPELLDFDPDLGPREYQGMSVKDIQKSVSEKLGIGG